MSEEYEVIEELDDDNNDKEVDVEEENTTGRAKKIALMGNSGQTDEQRRVIRRSQRQLFKEMEEQGDTLGVDEARKRNNNIFNNVRFTREAVLDGENLTLIANKASQKVDRLIQVPRYDASKLVKKLRQKCRDAGSSTGTFDWTLLGRQAGVCFNSIPSNVTFLNGSLTNGKELQVKQRAQRRRRVEEEEAEEEKPEDVQGHTTKDADQLSAIEKSMKVLDKTLHKKVDKRYNDQKRKFNEMYQGDIPKEEKKKLKKFGAEICATNYLFNPKSFTQTVENIFHYSFLVKKGTAALNIRKTGFGENGKPGPVVKYVNPAKAHPKNKQFVLNMTMKDYRDLLKAYEVTEGDLPHRTGSKHARQKRSQSQLSQSQLSQSP